MADQFHKQCIICGSKDLQIFPDYEAHDLVSCTNCSLKFVRKIPSIQQLKNYYSNYVYEMLDSINPINRIRYNALLDEFEQLGCFYKDWNFEFGLVDFPAIIDGEEVFLCWKSDEETLGWYHPVEEGFSARKAIPEHLLL